MAALDQVCAATVPRPALAGLAELRTQSSLTVHDAADDRVWLRWRVGDAAVLQHVLPLAGAELYVQQGGDWFRVGSRLPTAGPPEGDGRPLDRVLQPAPFEPISPPGLLPAPPTLRLVRDDQPRAATALRCSLAALAAWADAAPTADIVTLLGAWTGSEALLVGPPLPWLADGERYWGRRVLAPLGWRPDPPVPETALVDALGLGANQTAVLHEDGVEVVPEGVLQPLTRGAVRRALAAREQTA